MNSTATATQLDVFNSKIRATFGKLDEHDIIAIDGNADKLSEALKEKYGFSTTEVQSRLDSFAIRVPKKSTTTN